MLPAPQPLLQAHRQRLRCRRAGLLAALVAVSWPALAAAQDMSGRPGELPSASTTTPPPAPLRGMPIDQAINPPPPPHPTLPKAPEIPEGPIAFEANGVEYDNNTDVVTATGNVIMKRDDQSVRADTIAWHRKTGKIYATGNVRFVDADGNQLFADSVELTDELKTGAMQNLLLALREGGRLAAISGQRQDDGTILLNKAAYTGCDVVDSDGCPKTPSWRILAERVVYDPAQKRVRFTGARIEVFGMRLLPIPGLVLTTDGRPVSGLLIPDISLSASNGAQLTQPWYQRLGDDKDLTVTGYLFTKALPMVSAQYRQLTSLGAFQITGYATRSRRVPINGVSDGQTDFRGYLFANGKFQFNENWSLTTSIRVATDRTFLRRYDISRDDRLRSMFDLERIDDDSYFSLSGWATQTLRAGVSQGQVPVALPIIDYRRIIADPLLGGKIELQVNSLAISRSAGQDTQRAFASAEWTLRKLTSMGQEITFTGLLRGDVYHSDENDLTTTATYAGNPGWQARGVATAAVDVKWPLVGQVFGGTQVLTPRFQIVATPPVRNLEVPNEDSRAVDLEDSNLFSLNRFSGYDRIEDGVRFTYGVDWQFERPGWQISSTIGQSYRLSKSPTLLPDGTGLSGRLSDIVGRVDVRYHNLVKFTDRFRLDKDSFAIRRNEIDLTLGSKGTYIEAGYLRLNRNITTVEDLQDREELRLAGRIAFAKYWSVFGSTVINLTNKEEDPLSTSDGWEPLRTRVGVAYEDDCLELSATWRRDYAQTGDAKRGNTFQLHVAFRNLSFH